MRNLRFTLRYEKKEYVLDEQIPTIDDDSTQEEIEAHQKHYDDANKLKEIFQTKASKECLDVVKSLMACKPKPRASICDFVLKMKGYFDRLESLNMVFDAELSINIILFGLPADYNQFVLSYQMNGKETSIMELHSLKERLLIPTGKERPQKESPIMGKEAVCFYCNTKGHWKRSCPKYLKGLKDGKVKKGSHSGSKGKKEVEAWRAQVCQGKQENHACDKDWKVRAHAEVWTSPCKGIYETVKCISHNGNVILNVSSSNELDKSKLRHSRLGHINKKCITQLQKDGVLESFDFKSDDVFGSCLLGKMTKSPFTDGNRYYVTFTDDFSRYGYVYLIKHKSDTFEVFKRYENEVENQLGRKIKLTPPRTPQLNGVAKMRNRTLLDMVRSMMSRATLPISLWGYKGKRPSLGHIKIWGCEVFVKREAQDKLEARSEKCLFVGYPKESFGYLFYKPKDNVVFVARRGVFLEREMISKEDSGSKIDLEEIQEPAYEEPIVNTDTQQEVDKISDSTLSELDEHADYKEAMANPEAAKWKEAMKSEIQSMYDNLVWILVNTTPSLKMVGCKWIFKKKIDMDGKLHTYKARIMLAIAAFHDYEIWQMDVKTAFLNRKLIEDVFMAQPGGFENAKYPKRVCKLQNAIYGLKQASHSWNLYFHEKVT
ncbi:retrotransposon protein, putative, ty1-copia subclass [Tanacetum coccineum]